MGESSAPRRFGPGSPGEPLPAMRVPSSPIDPFHGGIQFPAFLKFLESIPIVIITTKHPDSESARSG